MLYKDGINKLHVEITNKCNAACPGCSRTKHDGTNKNLTEISFNDFKLFFPKDILSTFDVINFCGNYGDPSVAKDLLSIIEYIYTNNSEIKIMISTNGGTRSVNFWNTLGIMFYNHKHTNSHVVFCIDGLEDTNHIYRRNVDWNKLMDNVKAFNSTGALSQWRFIPFKHNQHQYPLIQDIYKQLGFDKLLLKISNRFTIDHKTTYSYIDKFNNIVNIEPSTTHSLLSNSEYPSVIENTIVCRAKSIQEIYLDAHGVLYPCCYLGYSSELQQNYMNNLYAHTFQNIICNTFFTKEIIRFWKIKYPICNNVCTRHSSKYTHGIVQPN